MKLRLILFGFVFGTATTLLSSQVLSTGETEEAQDEEEAKQRWQQYAFPGPHHDTLEFFEGEWDVTTKMWMPDENAPPVKSTATLSSKLIFGGRFVQSKMRGTMYFEDQGQMMEIPIEGIGFMGYDNFKKKYVSVWIDSHATGIYHSEGLADPEGKVFTFFGTSDDWRTGTHDKPVKYVDRIIDEDTITSEFYDLTGPRGEAKIMEMRSTRKKKY